MARVAQYGSKTEYKNAWNYERYFILKINLDESERAALADMVTASGMSTSAYIIHALNQLDGDIYTLLSPGVYQGQSGTGLQVKVIMRPEDKQRLRIIARDQGETMSKHICRALNQMGNGTVFGIRKTRTRKAHAEPGDNQNCAE